MGLKDRSPPQVRRITTSMMVLVLVAQILCGLVQPATVYAATALTISPDAMHDWQVTDDTANGGTVHFVRTSGSIGSGSAQFSLPGINQTQSLYMLGYGTTKLTDISTLAYDTYIATPTSIAPSLQLAIDTDTIDSDTSPQGQLVYSPYQNGQVTEGQWQHHNVRSGLWWFSDPAPFNMTCSQVSPCTLDAIITLYPNIGVSSSGGIGFVATNTAEPSISNVDGLMFNDDVYNFEAITAPQLVAPLNGSSNESTLVSSWQSVPTASKYIYESYSDDAMTQLRSSDAVTGTQKTEADLADSTTLWWRVKAVDAQGDEGNWSELWKVTVAKEEVLVSGIVSGEGSGQTEELIAQLVRLNEPFAVPHSLDTFGAPHVYTVMDGEGAVTSSDALSRAAIDSPVADQGVRTSAAVPTESGWKFFGVLWYWWALPIGALVAVVMRTVRLVRNSRTFLYSSDQI